tara:strand:- start:206 stop:2359 length:2154 start_codon:yes stop_codon:yes gene_type:complete
MSNDTVQELESIVDYAEKNSENKLSTYETIVDPIAATGAGIINSAASIPSLPEEIINLLRLGKDKAGQSLGLIDKNKKTTRANIPFLPSYEQMMNLTKKGEIDVPFTDTTLQIPNYDTILGDALSYDAQTGFGQYAQTAAEWATPSKLLKANPYISGGAGILSEVVEDFTPVKEGQGWIFGVGLDIVGQILNGVRNPAHIARLQTVMDDLVKNNQLKDAKDLMKYAKENNINLTAPEAILATVDESGTSLSSILSDTMSNPKGAAIVDTFTAQRFPQISTANREWLNKNLGELDLNLIEVDKITNKFVNTIKKRSENYRTNITERAKNYNSKIIKGGWDAFDNTIIVTSDGKAVKGIINANLKEYKLGIQKFLKDPENSSFREIYQKHIASLMPVDAPLTHTNLHKIYKTLGKKIKDLQGDVKPNDELISMMTMEKKKIGQILQQNDYWMRANEFTRKANRIVVDKAMKGLTVNGRIDNKTEGSLKLLNKILLGEDISPINVQRLSTELNKIDKTLFPELSNLLLSKKFEKLSKASGNKNVGFQFYEEVMGKGNEKLMKEIIYGSAKAQGKNPDEVWKGFQKLMLIYKGTGQMPSLNSATAARGEYFKDLRKLGIIVDEFSVAQPFEIILNPLRTMIADNRSAALAKIFTSADGIDQMINIGKQTKMVNLTNAVKEIMAQINNQAQGIDISGSPVEADDDRALKFTDGSAITVEELE